MTRPRSRSLALALAASVAAAVPAGAQALFGPVIRVGPQFVSYKIDAPVDRTISQFAVPIALAVPVAGRLVLDVATAYASSRFEEATRTEEISGLTDTQLRANYTFGNDNVILTAGLNLPTGHSTIDFEREAFAAGQIGNDFLAFPVSNMGTGFASTGGVALARAFGSWNLGAGAAFRYSSPWDAFEAADSVVQYQPGNEIRFRVGGDRVGSSGRLAIGATYSMFGDDEAGGFAYSTGDRLITQAGYQVNLGAATSLSLSAWDLYRFEGELLGDAVAPPENIANVALALGFGLAGATIEPNVEARFATSDDDTRRGQLTQFGLRLRRPLGKLELYPSAAYAIGKIGAADAGLTGLRGILTIRFTP